MPGSADQTTKVTMHQPPTDDPTFPALHGRPRRGWLNDPNGLCRFGDRYHVFFQYNPDAPTHGSITWGHVSSTDLLHWEDEPVALRPRPDEVDAAGCWSGCVVDDGGVPTAVYTAVRHTADDAWASLARGSTDLRRWSPDQAVICRPDDPSIEEVRDPFVFTHVGTDGEHRYVVQGAGAPDVDGRPQLLVYHADDLTRWQQLGALLDTDDPIAGHYAAANIWECPNLFQLDGRWVLLLSLWRARGRGDGVLSGVRYLIGDLREPDGGLRFVAESGGTLDHGPAFYAPQVLVETDRILLWGWAWELGRSAEQTDAAGWAGVLTFPRELALVDDELVSLPAAELTALRTAALDPNAIHDSAFELIGAGPITLSLQTGEHVQPVLEATSLDGGGATRVLVDGSLIEAFGGGQSFTTRAYPTQQSHWVAGGTDEAYRLEL